MVLSIALVKETPEPFPLPPEISIVRAAAGWAHCVAVTGNGTEFMKKDGFCNEIIASCECA